MLWNVILCTSFIYFFYVASGGFLFLFALDDADGGDNNNQTDANYTIMEEILLEENFTDEQLKEIHTKFDPDIPGIFELHYVDHWWMFINSFCFSFHICTTIGYGNLSPLTQEGQFMTIVYGILGIPIHMLFYKILGDSFTSAMEETIWLIQGDVASPRKRHLAVFIFFFISVFILIVAPSITFMFLEDWSFIDGVYFSFMTLASIGLGDLVAGERMNRDVYHFIYKVVLLYWMFVGIGFFSMIVDSLALLYKRNLLYTVECDWRKGHFKLLKVELDIERLDLHFMLLKAKGVKLKVGFWSSKQQSEKVHVYYQNHLKNLVLITNNFKSLLTREMKRKFGKLMDAFPVREKQSDDGDSSVPNNRS